MLIINVIYCFRSFCRNFLFYIFQLIQVPVYGIERVAGPRLVHIFETGWARRISGSHSHMDCVRT